MRLFLAIHSGEGLHLGKCALKVYVWENVLCS